MNSVNSLKGFKFWRDDYCLHSRSFIEQSLTLGNGFYCEFTDRLSNHCIMSFRRDLCSGRSYYTRVSLGISSRRDHIGLLWILAIFSDKFHYTITAESRYGYKLMSDLYWDLRRVKSGAEFAKLLNEFIVKNSTDDQLKFHKSDPMEIRHLKLSISKAKKESKND